MALLGGLGGGITRDVLVNQVPGALTNPAYITLAVVLGVVGYRLGFAKGQLFREGLFQFMTSFSLACVPQASPLTRSAICPPPHLRDGAGNPLLRPPAMVVCPPHPTRG
jgi:hypothetical protein